MPAFSSRASISGRPYGILSTKEVPPELKKVQWYQFEISHVTVAPGQKRKGLALDLVKEAEREAVAQGQNSD
jgi:hypothetical protein